ncbi:hypothetical protein CHU98_g6012 [Xylaria longipes]|nr:hypothetical protein CHU98_g6012 [Xylaria longipes]
MGATTLAFEHQIGPGVGTRRGTAHACNHPEADKRYLPSVYLSAYGTYLPTYLKFPGPVKRSGPRSWSGLGPYSNPSWPTALLYYHHTTTWHLIGDIPWRGAALFTLLIVAKVNKPWHISHLQRALQHPGTGLAAPSLHRISRIADSIVYVRNGLAGPGRVQHTFLPGTSLESSWSPASV